MTWRRCKVLDRLLEKCYANLTRRDVSSLHCIYSRIPVIVKASNGPRYVVGCRTKVNKAALKPGTRVALDMTTLTIMRALPREVDPLVYNMLKEDPGNVAYAQIGGLGEQIRQLREVCSVHWIMVIIVGDWVTLDEPRVVCSCWY